MILTNEFDAHVAEARQVNEMLSAMPILRLGSPEEIALARSMMLGAPADSGGDTAGSAFSGFMAPPVLPVSESSIPGPAGDLPVRIFRPDQVDAVYLDIHGGAWIIGSAQMMDSENSRLAAACNVAVVSVDYRLAPEDPWPAGADDCEAAAAWLLDHAADEFGVDRLLIGGSSAGSTLSAITLLRMRDRGVVDRFIGANLVFGCYDLSRTPSQRTFETTPIIDAEVIRQVVPLVCPGVDVEGLRDPSISALYADLHGLPPALFTVGTNDPLLDDSLFMAARWELAGNDADLVVYPESPHGFTGLGTGMANAAQDRMHDFVRRCIKNSG